MTLESQQFKDDRLKAIIGNTSGSNEPVQVIVDSQDQLDQLQPRDPVGNALLAGGAETIARMEAAGFTREQAMAEIDRAAKTQSSKRTNPVSRKRGSKEARGFAERNPNFSNIRRESERRGEVEGIRYKDDRQMDMGGDFEEEIFGPYSEDIWPQQVLQENEFVYDEDGNKRTDVSDHRPVRDENDQNILGYAYPGTPEPNREDPAQADISDYPVQAMSEERRRRIAQGTSAQLQGATESAVDTQRARTVREKIMSSFTPEGQAYIEQLGPSGLTLGQALQGPLPYEEPRQVSGGIRTHKTTTGPTLTRAEKAALGIVEETPYTAAKPTTVSDILRETLDPGLSGDRYANHLDLLGQLSRGEISLDDELDVIVDAAVARQRQDEYGNPAAEKAAMKRRSAEMAESDRSKLFSSERSKRTRRANEERAEAGSEINAGVRARMEELPNFVESRQFGPAGALGIGLDDSEIILQTEDTGPVGTATNLGDGVYIDPVTGNPLAVQGPTLPEVGRGAESMTASDFIRAYIPEMSPSAATTQTATGAQQQFREVNINDVLTNFEERMSALQGYTPEGSVEQPFAGLNVRAPRNRDDLEAIVAEISGMAPAGKDTDAIRKGYIAGDSDEFEMVDDGKVRRRVRKPKEQTRERKMNYEAVLSRLGLGGTREKEQLANALMQMAQSSGTSFTPGRTGGGAVVLTDETGNVRQEDIARIPRTGITVRQEDAPGLSSSGEVLVDREGTPVKRIVGRTNSNLAPGEERKVVSRAAALRQLDDEDAAKPYIGAIGKESQVRSLKAQDAGRTDDQIRQRMEDKALLDEIEAQKTEIKRKLKATGKTADEGMIREAALIRIKNNPAGLEERKRRLAANAEIAIGVRNRSEQTAATPLPASGEKFAFSEPRKGFNMITGERQGFNEGTSDGQAAAVGNKINIAAGGERVIPTAGSGAEIANGGGSFGPQPIKPLLGGAENDPWNATFVRQGSKPSAPVATRPQAALPAMYGPHPDQRPAPASAPSRKNREDGIFNNIKRGLTGRTARRIGSGAVFAGGLASRLNEMQQEEN